MTGWWLPRSLRGRFVLIMVAGVVSAQLASYAVWTSQVRDHHMQQVDELSGNVAHSLTSTVEFFRSLPVSYRHIVLEQLRNMGGSRFLVSVNSERLNVPGLGDSPERDLIVGNVRSALDDRLGIRDAVVELSHAEELPVFSNDMRLADLPPRWAQYSLLLEPMTPPIVVVQIEMETDQWLYVAALLPMPDLLQGSAWLQEDRLFVLVVAILTVIGLSLFGIRWVTRPLADIARSARSLGQDLHAQPVPEAGPRETVETARAFNRMQERIREHVRERERLFSAISHDLKTPITRMRLRAEMLDDPQQREQFATSLEELEGLVRNALACARGMNVDEPLQLIDPGALVSELVDDFGAAGYAVHLRGRAEPLRGRRQALRRCFSTLLENAVTYGSRAEVRLRDDGDNRVVTIRDSGPGIPEEDQERVLEPYVRLEGAHRQYAGGTGLGLAIAHHIVQSHGGSLRMRNHPGGGLEITLVLPGDPSA